MELRTHKNLVFEFYDLNKQEADYIEHTFQKFVTLVNNGKIWDQNNWKSN